MNQPARGDAKHSEATLLWLEYEHRHSHCWAMLFRVTATVSVLGSVPYMNKTVTAVLGSWILLSPILALVLALAGALVMHRELAAFAKIKAAFRAVQSRLSSVAYNERSRFTLYLLVYMYSLSGSAAANIYVASKIWLPAIRAAGA